MMRFGIALIGAVVASLALAPSAASAPRVIDAYCSPTGDFCQSVFIHDRMLKLEMRQFPLRGPYAICVKPPRNQPLACKKFRWRKAGPMLAGRVTAARHFPIRARGVYRVAWFTSDGQSFFRVGRVLQFRRR